jgi:nicotinate-nucleotide adenylyltransferase
VKIGILGGTFDPPHNGHLAAAREAMERLRLERVLFIPAGDPWMKAESTVTPAEQREEMVRLAIRGHPRYAVSRIEIDRPGPTYTVDTLEALRWEFGHKTELYFILGMDALAGLPKWRRPDRIAQLSTLVAVTRPGTPHSDRAEVEKQVPGLKGRLVFLEGLSLDVSSTEVRRKVAAGESISNLVPAAVEEYIREKGLYKLGRAGD